MKREHELTSFETVETWLTKHGIPYTVFRHQALATKADDHHRPLFEGEFEGTLMSKNLFMWDKKNQNKFTLVCASLDTDVKTKFPGRRVGVKPDNFRFGEAKPLQDLLGCR